MALSPQHIMPAQMVAPAGFTATLMQQHMSGEMVLQRPLMVLLGTRTMICHVYYPKSQPSAVGSNHVVPMHHMSGDDQHANALSQLHKAPKWF
jgi:hypothetical protein